MAFFNRFIDKDLLAHWLICLMYMILIVMSMIICLSYGKDVQWVMNETDRVLLRTILYGVTIVLFPTVKLLRYILLRLNQTMPPDHKTARMRYFGTVVICLSLIELVGGFGIIMFLLGDEQNTLYIFILLAGLGIFLHKPNTQEYQTICWTLETVENEI